MKLKREERNLIRRYLVWCYKTTKEELDRIDRKFTQLTVDYFLLKEISKRQNASMGSSQRQYSKFIDEFNAYIRQKERDAAQTKFLDKKKAKPYPRYEYLRNRFLAIEKAISFFLGKKELDDITVLYEWEMTRRILAASDHK